jgi:hypothetical protein
MGWLVPRCTENETLPGGDFEKVLPGAKRNTRRGVLDAILVVMVQVKESEVRV